MEKKWTIKARPTEQQITSLAQELNIEPVLASILIQRGVNSFEQAERFFSHSLENLYDAFLMKNMEKAFNRLDQALQQQEKILLFGDYDVDGTSAVALMYNVLKAFTPALDFYIPDRYTEGYGLSQKGVDFAVENDFKLLITLDCGIKANDLISDARSRGLDVIVCDHHEPGEEVPNAIVLDPKQQDCNYPYKELTGCGVGFKLLQALFQYYDYDKTPLFSQHDLLAMSISSDIVPITDENRILAHFGLQLINEKPRLGIKALVKEAKATFPMSLTNVVFILAPRINAAGRIQSGRRAVELLISTNADEVNRLATEIEADNQERRGLDEMITQHAFELIEEDSTFEQRKTTVLFHESWHKGVIGIVASRIMEKHYRPTIILTESNGKITGSARSVRGLNIHDALDKCAYLLEQFGGHAFAAGMTLEKENLIPFKERFEAVVDAQLSLGDLIPEQIVDDEIQLNSLFEEHENRFSIPKFKRILNRLEPHGPGNMKPVFVLRNAFAKNVRILKDLHLKFQVYQLNSGIELDAIAFNMAEKFHQIDGDLTFDVIFTLETNTWNNKETLQLNVKDIRSVILT